MSYKEQWISGDWKAQCDYCNQYYKASELSLDWMGYRACPKDLTFRNQQDFVRPKPERISTPWARRDSDSITDFANVFFGGNNGHATITASALDTDGYRLILESFSFTGCVLILPTVGSTTKVGKIIISAPSNQNASTIQLATTGGDTITGSNIISPGDYFELLVNPPSNWQRLS